MKPTLHREFPKPKIDDPDVYVRFANNIFGKKIRSCHQGEFNLSKDENNNLWVHIYYQGKEVIKLIMYKNPYHIAESILKPRDPYKVIKKINNYRSQGLQEGKDFTITLKGVFLRPELEGEEVY